MSTTILDYLITVQRTPSMVTNLRAGSKNMVLRISQPCPNLISEALGARRKFLKTRLFFMFLPLIDCSILSTKISKSGSIQTVLSGTVEVMNQYG